MSSLLVVLGVALVASLFMSFTVGANSNSAPIAPAVGANALSVLRAALLVGVVAGLGALLQGGNISETIGRSLVTGVKFTPLAAAATLELSVKTERIVNGVVHGNPHADGSDGNGHHIQGNIQPSHSPQDNANGKQVRENGDTRDFQ